MTRPFFRLPVSSPSATIKLDPAKITEFYPWDTEVAAFWDLSKKSARSVNAGHLLTPQNAANPVNFTDAKLNFTSAYGNFIGSDLTDTMIPAHTYAAVVYIPDRGTATDIFMMAGNYRRDTAGTGSALMCLGKKFLASNGGISSNAQATVDVVAGWCFVSISIDVVQLLHEAAGIRRRDCRGAGRHRHLCQQHRAVWPG